MLPTYLIYDQNQIILANFHYVLTNKQWAFDILKLIVLNFSQHLYNNTVKKLTF